MSKTQMAFPSLTLSSSGMHKTGPTFITVSTNQFFQSSVTFVILSIVLYSCFLEPLESLGLCSVMFHCSNVAALASYFNATELAVLGFLLYHISRNNVYIELYINVYIREIVETSETYISCISRCTIHFRRPVKDLKFAVSLQHRD